MALNWHKLHNKSLQTKKSLSRSPPKELKEGPCSKRYLLVCLNSQRLKLSPILKPPVSPLPLLSPPSSLCPTPPPPPPRRCARRGGRGAQQRRELRATPFRVRRRPRRRRRRRLVPVVLVPLGRARSHPLLLGGVSGGWRLGGWVCLLEPPIRPRPVSPARVRYQGEGGRRTTSPHSSPDERTPPPCSGLHQSRPLPSNVSMSSYVRDLKRLQKQTILSYKLLLTLVVFSYSTPPTPTPTPAPAGVGSTVRVTTIVRALPADSPTDVKLSE